MTTEIKPCPFKSCRGEAYVRREEGIGGHYSAFVECLDCCATGPTYEAVTGKTKDQAARNYVSMHAVALWNEVER